MRETKIIILLTLIFSCFISCNNLADIRVENTESNSQENIELTEESSNKQFAKLYINLQGRGRTIQPSDPEVSMLSNFSLSGNIKGEEEKNLGTWRNLESLQNKTIILEPGNWEFCLTASKDSSKYSGNVDVVLHKGDNQVNFAKGVQKRTLERSKEDRQRPKRDSVNYAVSMFRIKPEVSRLRIASESAGSFWSPMKSPQSSAGY